MTVISEPAPALSRQEQKERTREAILTAALSMTREQGFAQISLRQVAREAGVVPTAFYRHFVSMEELGLALVAQSFVTLRTMVRNALNEAQANPAAFANVIDASAEILVRTVKDHKADFGFIARERFGGQGVVREAIRREIDQFVNELAVVLGRLPNIDSWSVEDVHMVSRLFVRNLVSHAEDVVEIPDGRPDLEDKVREDARREMRLIVLGFRDWKS